MPAIISGTLDDAPAIDPLHEGDESPPRGVAVMALLRWLILAAVAALAVTAWWSYAHADPTLAHAPRYQCPMHPQITAADPGECPICHMDLEPIDPARAHNHADHTAPAPTELPTVHALPHAPRAEQSLSPGTCSICKMDLTPLPAASDPPTVFRCPMHPAEQSLSPGTCPICKMDLDAPIARSPPGTAPLQLTLERQQSIGVRTSEALALTRTPTLRAPATLELAESGAAQVHVRAAGFLEKIAVSETGVRVHKGQRLADLYSPEIYQAQTELLAARRWADGNNALAAARARLELLGMSRAAIDRLVASGKPSRTVAVEAPASGVVVARSAVLGAYVTPETALYELRDPDTLYVVAELPAGRGEAITAGAPARLTIPTRPGFTRDLRVDLVYPELARDARSFRARLTVTDPTLRAGEYALVDFALPAHPVARRPPRRPRRHRHRDPPLRRPRRRPPRAPQRHPGRVLGRALRRHRRPPRRARRRRRHLPRRRREPPARRPRILSPRPVPSAMQRIIGSILEACARHRGVVLLLYAMLALLAVRSARQVPLDAIPDLSDPQVIVFTEWRGRSPTLVEDQVTYPISSALLAAPQVQAVRGYSMFGMSFVHVLFAEDVDVYWARSRVQEYLSTIQARLPEGVTATLGPDATGIGWVYEYALVDRSGQHDLAELRAIQDFSLRYALESVPGVAQVASVGGFEKQYQVQLDPDRLRAFGLATADVGDVIRRGNAEVGGRVLEIGGREAFIRGRGYLGGEADLADLVVKTGPGGTPIRVGDVGAVRLGPELRRGLAELNGEGEVVGAIVIARHDTDALDVIERVKTRLAALDAGLPEGVEVVPTYDRSALIHRAVDTLRPRPARGGHRRRPRHHALPDAPAQRPAADPEPPARRPARLHPDGLARHPRDDHEPRRHRHRRRRHRRRRDRHDRGLPQAPRARPQKPLDPRAPASSSPRPPARSPPRSSSRC
jgi:hypothetical protein